MTELMVSAGVAPREKFTTIYSGMEVEPLLRSAEHRQRVRRELGYGPEDVVIGKIARLFKLKGHADVIEAARSVIGPEKGTVPVAVYRPPGRLRPRGTVPFFRPGMSAFCLSATAFSGSGSSGRSPRRAWPAISSSPAWCRRSGSRN